MQIPGCIRRRLCALRRYFFVKAPTRAESQHQIEEETRKRNRAVQHLIDELERLERAITRGRGTML